MRWPGRLGAILAVLLIVVAPPALLMRLAGWPQPSWPTLAQLERWVADPLTPHTLTVALTVAAWLLWLLLVVTIALRLLARVRAVARWMQQVPLPTPLQATATGLAGVAVFGTHTPSTTTPVVDHAAATTPATDSSTGDLTARPNRQTPDQNAEAAGVVVPGGWVPQDTAEQIAAAGALLWLRRRRTYRPAGPNLARGDTDLAPLPPVVTAAQAAVAAQPARPDDSTAAAGRKDDHRTVFPPGGVGLTGAGAADAARGILVTAALQALRAPAAAARVVTTRAAIDALLAPQAKMAPVAGIHVAATLDDAVVAATTSTSQPASADREQATGRQTVLLLTQAPTDPEVRSRLIQAAGHPDLTVVILEDWPTGDTWNVDSSGHIHSQHHPDRHGWRMCVLDTVAARDLLAVISPPNSPATADQTSPRLVLAPLVPKPQTPARTSDDSGAKRQPDAPKLRIRVLGGVTVTFQNTPVTIRRSAALQALVFLAVHPQGATGRDLIEAIWPGPPAHRVTGRLYTTISELRRTIRDATGTTPISHTDDRYHLDPDLDIDLWHLQHAVRHAATAVTGRTTALRQVIDQYSGPLADSYTWPWLDPHREALRRHIVDAHLALADTHTDPRQTLAILQDAMRVDPYNEELHQRAARTLTELDDHSAATNLLHTYTHRLTEAGLPPHPPAPA